MTNNITIYGSNNIHIDKPKDDCDLGFSRNILDLISTYFQGYDDWHWPL